jgi:tRNA C32,U32 (ribose-2'-O)-methylase TrmJ
MLGNEGTGLNERQMRACDSFAYISQYGVGTASLNVAVAASIVLHHYAVWAGYQERSRQGYKFDVAERPEKRSTARGMVPLTEIEREELRAKRAEGGNNGSDGEDFLDFSGNGLP